MSNLASAAVLALVACTAGTDAGPDELSGAVEADQPYSFGVQTTHVP